MKVERDYKYDSRTLAVWCYDKILGRTGSYYSIFKKVSSDKELRKTIKEVMEHKDETFCDSLIKIALIKSAILYILASSPNKIISRKEIINTVINNLIVSPQVIERPTKKGRKSNLESEIGWEIYHLVKEGKVEKVVKGYYCLS